MVQYYCIISFLLQISFTDASAYLCFHVAVLPHGAAIAYQQTEHRVSFAEARGPIPSYPAYAAEFQVSELGFEQQRTLTNLHECFYLPKGLTHIVFCIDLRSGMRILIASTRIFRMSL